MAFIMYTLFCFATILSRVLSSPQLGARDVAATCGTLPAAYVPPKTAKLPDPFTFVNGTKVTTSAAWACRQAEISTLFQTYELGTKPSAPSTVKGSLLGNTLSISVSNGNKSISFSPTINYPTSGAGPYPVLIAFGGASIPVPSTVATINFNNDDLAAQIDSSSRGKGKFYDLYGASHPAGAMSAWAWGVSRIIDVLETLNTTRKIDSSRIGVTGCSRNGKGAFVAGALDSRIALTIPQESGAGGAACWRVSDSQHAAGANIQTASEIVQENVWFSTRFNTYATNTSVLPEDHHLLAGLVAPRGLLVIENDIDWLGPVSTTACMEVGRRIYKAVGAPDAMGFSLLGGHAHCSFPAAQQPELSAFFNKYLLKGNSSTANVEKSSAKVDLSDWVDWKYPNLTSRDGGWQAPGNHVVQTRDGRWVISKYWA